MRVEGQRLPPQIHQNPSVCFADISLWERETNHQPAAFPPANLRRLTAPPPSQGRRLPITSLTALADTSPNSSSRAVAECQMMPTVKIATATTSREIFLVNDYDGIFKERVEFQRLRRKSIRIPLSLRDIPLWKRGTNHQPSACPSANLRRLRRHLLPKEGG